MKEIMVKTDKRTGNLLKDISDEISIAIENGLSNIDLDEKFENLKDLNKNNHNLLEQIKNKKENQFDINKLQEVEERNYKSLNKKIVDIILTKNEYKQFVSNEIIEIQKFIKNKTNEIINNHNNNFGVLKSANFDIKKYISNEVSDIDKKLNNKINVLNETINKDLKNKIDMFIKSIFDKLSDNGVDISNFKNEFKISDENQRNKNDKISNLLDKINRELKNIQTGQGLIKNNIASIEERQQLIEMRINLPWYKRMWRTKKI